MQRRILVAIIFVLSFAVSAQEQKVIYLDGVVSKAMQGDKDVDDKGILPTLLKQGWHIESVHPTSDGKAFAVLIAPPKGRQ